MGPIEWEKAARVSPEEVNTLVVSLGHLEGHTSFRELRWWRPNWDGQMELLVEIVPLCCTAEGLQLPRVSPTRLFMWTTFLSILHFFSKTLPAPFLLSFKDIARV